MFCVVKQRKGCHVQEASFIVFTFLLAKLITAITGILMGGIQRVIVIQYEVLRGHDCSPSEAFNKTFEEATRIPYLMIGANGMQ